MSQSVSIFVRNDNDSITYVGDWSIVQASTVDSLVNSINGQAFSPTLHSTTTTSNFIFPYKGSSISVIGTIDTAQSKHDPSWVCAIDGIPIDTFSVSSINDENMQTLCQQEEISDGAHELVVNVTSQGTPFYLDILRYSPSPDVSLDNSLIVIENNDSRVDFISGWEPLGIQNGTTDPEGLVNVTFTGVQLAWYGYIPFSKPHTNASLGEFSIDDQPYTSFQIPGLQNSFTSTAFNQLLFTTPMLEMGSHVLSAKYTGGPGQTPFTFEYLIVTNGSFSSLESSSTTSGESSSGKTSGNPLFHPTGTPSTNGTGKESPHVGSIVGSVVGGIGGIVLCLILVIFCLKSRKRRGRDRSNARRIIEPYFVLSQLIDISKSQDASLTTTSQSIVPRVHSTQLIPLRSWRMSMPLAPSQIERSNIGLCQEPGEAATISDSVPPSYHTEYIY